MPASIANMILVVVICVSHFINMSGWNNQVKHNTWLIGVKHTVRAPVGWFGECFSGSCYWMYTLCWAEWRLQVLPTNPKQLAGEHSPNQYTRLTLAPCTEQSTHVYRRVFNNLEQAIHWCQPAMPTCSWLLLYVFHILLTWQVPQSRERDAVSLCRRLWRNILSLRMSESIWMCTLNNSASEMCPPVAAPIRSNFCMVKRTYLKNRYDQQYFISVWM